MEQSGLSIFWETSVYTAFFKMPALFNSLPVTLLQECSVLFPSTRCRQSFLTLPGIRPAAVTVWCIQTGVVSVLVRGYGKELSQL